VLRNSKVWVFLCKRDLYFFSLRTLTPGILLGLGTLTPGILLGLGTLTPGVVPGIGLFLSHKFLSRQNWSHPLSLCNG
jgi:hypothetical protein